jgi:hypothetical protein
MPIIVLDYHITLFKKKQGVFEKIFYILYIALQCHLLSLKTTILHNAPELGHSILVLALSSESSFFTFSLS